MGTPTSGVAGASIASQSQRRLTQAPLRGKPDCEGQKRRLAACATRNETNISDLAQFTSDETFEVKLREKRAKDPSKFVSVRKNPVLCFVGLTGNLNETMFRLERVVERTNWKGRRGGRKPASLQSPVFVELSGGVGLISNEKRRESSYQVDAAGS